LFISKVRANTNLDATSDILLKRGELIALCERVCKLEALVCRVRDDVDKMETLVVNAETDIKSTTEGKIRSILKPFFSVSPLDSYVFINSTSQNNFLI
jgi:hypothetical protein